MSITSFDRPSLRILRADLDKTLAEVAERHGITISIGRITFTDNEFRAKLTANTGSSAELDQAKSDASDSDLAKLSILHNLPENLRGRKLQIGNSTFVISGAKLSRPKYPFIVTGAQGGKYKMSVNDIRAGLADRGELVRKEVN